MAFCPKGLGSATTVSTYNLTAEQLHYGITLGAQGNYEERQRQLQCTDWSKAVPIVRQELFGNTDWVYLTDEQIKPTAEQVHESRLQEEHIKFINAACELFNKEGVSNPSHQEVLLRAAEIVEDERQALQDKDWLDSEKSSRNGTVWWPCSKLDEIKPAPPQCRCIVITTKCGK